MFIRVVISNVLTLKWKVHLHIKAIHNLHLILPYLTLATEKSRDNYLMFPRITNSKSIFKVTITLFGERGSPLCVAL